MKHFRWRLGQARLQARRWIESYRQSPAYGRMEAQVERNEPAFERSDPDVIFFNASTRTLGMSQNAAFSLIASWMLRLAGVPVRYLACDSGLIQCMLGTRVEAPLMGPPCRGCTSFTRRVLPESTYRFGFVRGAHPDLASELEGRDLTALQSFTYDGLPLGELCLPSLRWALRRHNLLDDAVTARLLRDYMLGAWNVAQAFQSLLDKRPCRAAVLFNGQSFPEAVARQLAAKAGVSVITHEVGLRPLSAFFTQGEATAYPLKIPENFQLDEEANMRLDRYLSQRFKGDFSMAGIRFWPEMEELDAGMQSKLAAYRLLVPVFTNVIFDTSQAHANVLFDTMFSWLEGVLALAEKHPEALFVIRAHPDEIRAGKASHESVQSKLEEWGTRDVPNLMFIPADAHISSYELIRRASFVMVYNSSIGLEASILGARVLCGGQARYTHYPTVDFPSSATEYWDLAKQLIAAGGSKARPEQIIEARRFLYYQLFHSSLDFSAFLTQSPGFPGQVRLREFEAAALTTDRSREADVIVHGILDGAPFVYPSVE